MKRLSVALLLCGALTNTLTLSAQTKSTPSRISISTGVGLFPTYYKAGESKAMPPMTFKLGYDVSKSFTLGGFFGFSNSTSSPKIFAEGTNSYITNKTKVFGLRGEFRKEFTDRVCGYGGSMIGYHHADVKEYNNSTKALVVRAEKTPTPLNPNPKKGKMTYTAFMGASVKMTKKVSLYGEIGYGISIANLGVSVRI